jgi:acyl dehydratase
MTDSSLVESAFAVAREQIGRVQQVSIGRVEARDLQRFAISVGGPNPALDGPQGGQAGSAEIEAPPLYLSSVMSWDGGPTEEQLRPDGVGEEQIGGVSLEGLRLMGAGQELEFHEPVLSGTELTMEVSVVDVQCKAGKTGTLLLLVLLRRYLTTDGVALLSCRETLIGR